MILFGYIYTHANPVTNFDYDGFRARKSGGHNSRIQRKAQAIRSRAQSLTQRLKNLQNKQEGREQVIKDLVDGLDKLKEMLDKLNDPYLPMKCIKLVCPWDQKNICFAAPQMSPIRAPENGCKCDKFVLVP